MLLCRHMGLTHTTNWARERGGISSVLVHVLSFSSNAFLGTNKISSLSLDKLPPPKKKGIEGKRKKERKKFPISSFDTDLFAIRLASILPRLVYSFPLPQQLPFSTYTQNTHRTRRQSHIHAHAVSCPAEGNPRCENNFLQFTVKIRLLTKGKGKKELQEDVARPLKNSFIHRQQEEEISYIRLCSHPDHS